MPLDTDPHGLPDDAARVEGAPKPLDRLGHVDDQIGVRLQQVDDVELVEGSVQEPSGVIGIWVVFGCA